MEARRVKGRVRTRGRIDDCGVHRKVAGFRVQVSGKQICSTLKPEPGTLKPSFIV
jgi:hypothetical protein